MEIRVPLEEPRRPSRSPTWIRAENGFELIPALEENRSAVPAEKPPVVVGLWSDLIPPRSHQLERSHVVRACILRAQQIEIPFRLADDSAEFNSPDWRPNIDSVNIRHSGPKNHRRKWAETPQPCSTFLCSRPDEHNSTCGPAAAHRRTDDARIPCEGDHEYSDGN